MAALPGADPEAHQRPKGAPATDGVAVEGCYCKATATTEGPSRDATTGPASCCGKSLESSSPEALCYAKAPLLPEWLHADVAAAVENSCNEGTVAGKSFNWYSAAGASPAGAGGWRSPPMCCSTAVSPSSRCEQLSCCGSPASRWGECCCISGLQLQQLRGADTPTLQLAASSAGDSPLVLRGTPIAGPGKGDSDGPHRGAGDAAGAAEARTVTLKEVATDHACSATDDGQNRTDTEKRGRASRRSSPDPVAAEVSEDIAAVAVAVLPPPAVEASSVGAAAGNSTSLTCSFLAEIEPKETPESYTAVQGPVEPAATATAVASATTTEATPEGDTEGWISVKPRRQRRWADVPLSEDEADPIPRPTRRPPASPPTAAGRHSQRHSGAPPSRQRKACSYGERSLTAQAAAHRQQHPHYSQPSSCVFRAAVAAGLVAPTRDTFVAPTEHMQQKKQQHHPQQQQQQQQQQTSPEDSRGHKGPNNSSNASAASSASCSRSWCLWYDACGNETNGNTKSSNNSKGRLQEEYERGLVQIGRSSSLKGIMQLWSLLTARALGGPGNLAVAVGGCTPLWEDPQNRQGGHFAIRNLSGKGQAMELFFLLLRSFDQHHPHRNRRPVCALLSSLTGVVLCLRNNDRSHKVEVWVGSTAPQTVRQQELQLRGVLSSLAAGPYRLDVGFLSHEACLSKNQRKLRMKSQKREPEDAGVSPPETSPKLQHPRQHLPTQDQAPLLQQQQKEQGEGLLPSFSPAKGVAATVGEMAASTSGLPSDLHDMAPSTCGSVSTDTGSSRRSSNRGGGCCNNGRCKNGSMGCLFFDVGHSHPSYKSVILRGSALEEQQEHGGSPLSSIVEAKTPSSSSCGGSPGDTGIKPGDEGRKTEQADTSEPLHHRSRQQARQQQCRAGSNRSSKSPAAAPKGKSFNATARVRDSMCIDDVADPAAAATVSPLPAGGVRGAKGGQKGGLALESGTRGKRMGRQKLQRRQYGGSCISSAAVCPEQRLLQHLYAFDAREIPDYFSMQQAAYQGRAAVYASYAACASAALMAEPVAPPQQQQTEALWDFPPLSSAATCYDRYQSQKQHQRQPPDLQPPCIDSEETTNSINSCSLRKEEQTPAKSGKHFAFNPYAPGFVMPSRPLSAQGGDAPTVSGAAAAPAACSTIDDGSECSSATAADICSELLLPAGVAPDVSTIPSVPVSSAGEEVQAAVAAAEAAAAAGYMGGLFDVDFVDPRDPSSLLLITLMLHPALDNAAPLQVPLLPLTKLEGDAEIANSQAPSINLADPSRLSLTLDYEETTQTLSVDIVQS